MAELFETLKLEWGGATYEVSPTLELIGKVENIITSSELHDFLERGAYPFAKLAMAFGLIIRAGGARVTDKEVWEGMFSGDDGKASGGMAVSALLMMMIPPADAVDESTKKK